MSVRQILQEASLVFWDFDGVIKDSVGVKTRAFELLFESYGRDVEKRVRDHHEANGGLSRFEKIPLYLRWAGEPADEAQVDAYCARFSGLAMQAVIDAPWVPGVREYLLDRHQDQTFVLLTATPQQEIETILDAIGLAQCFAECHGAPTPKSGAIADVLSRMGIDPRRALMVGDSENDYAAAQKNDVGFVLRKTVLNRTLQLRHHVADFETLPHSTHE